MISGKGWSLEAIRAPARRCPLAILAVAAGGAAIMRNRANNRAGRAEQANAAAAQQASQQALRRRQSVLAKLFAQYNFDPTEWGLGNPLKPGGFAQPMAQGAEDYWDLPEVPEYQGTPWWEAGASGALQGVGGYFGTRPGNPSNNLTPSTPATMNSGGNMILGGSGGPGDRGYALSPIGGPKGRRF